MLAEEKVLYQTQEVASVLVKTLCAADATDLVEVEYEGGCRIDR